MRRGQGAGKQKIGGAWECAAMPRVEESKPWDSPDADRTANTEGEKDMPDAAESCTKGACIAGMVLQQS